MKKILLLLIPFLLIGLSSYADHILGSDMSYKYLGLKPGDPTKDRYEVTLTYYRDCSAGGAQLSSSYEFGVYNALTNAQVFRFNVNQISLVTIFEYAPKCRYPGAICIQEGIYKATIEVPNNITGNPGFHVSHYTYRRSTAGQNLNIGNNQFGPDGLTVYAYIPPSSFANTSPVFLAKPVPYMCVSSNSTHRQFRFNHNGYDSDGDSLVFSFAHPYGGIGTGGNTAGNPVAGVAGGVPNTALPIGAIPRPNPPLPGALYNVNAQSYQLVNYRGGYGFPNAVMPTLAGTGGLQIDQATGEITVEPGQVGNYVLTVEVKEFRVNRATGVATYLGSIRRDLIFYVGNTCTNNFPPVISVLNVNPPQASLDSFVVNEGQTLTFTVNLNDTSFAPNPFDSVWLRRSGTIFGGVPGTSPPFAVLNQDSGRNVVNSNFSWTPNCNSARVAPYFFNIIAVDQNCNRTEKTIFIKVKPREIILPPELRCVRTLDNANIQLSWIRSPSDSADFRLYRIYRRVYGSGTAWSLVDSVKIFSATNWIDTKATNAELVKYEYQVTAVNKCYEEGLPSERLRSIVVQGIKLAPQTLKLNWNRITNLPGYGTTFMVYSEDQTTGNQQFIGSTIDTLLTLTRCDLKNVRFRVEITDPKTGCVSLSRSPIFTLKDTVPPKRPDVIGASILSGSSIQIDFLKSDSLDVGEYVIFRSLNGGAMVRYDSLPSTGAASYVYTDINTSTRVFDYCYEVFAKDTCDNLSRTGEQHCTVKMNAVAGQTSVSLTWDQYLGFTISQHEVQRSINGGPWATIGSVGANVFNYIDNGLSPCLDYGYRIRIFDQSSFAYISLSSDTIVRPIDTIPPPPATIVSATVLSPTAVQIFFNPSTKPSVARYEVFYTINGSPAPPVSVGRIYPSGAGVQNLVAGGLNTVNNKYCFQIEAWDSCTNLNSAPSNAHCVVNLVGTPGSLRAILNWNYYSGYSNGITSYQVEKQIGGVWTPISPLLPNTANSYVDSIGLACGVRYYYRIVGKENGGGSYTTLSNEVFVIPFDFNPPPDVDIRSVTVTSNNTAIDVKFATVNDPTVSEYWILLSGNGGPFNNVATVPLAGGPILTYRLNGLQASNTKYCVKVLAVDTCGSQSDEVRAEVHCAILQSSRAGNLSANLRWSRYRGFNVTGYEVQKLNRGTGTWNVLTTTNDTFYTEAPMPCNIREFYRIRAVENGGNAEITFSDIDTITPFDTIKPLPPTILSATINNGFTDAIVYFRPSPSPDVNQYRVFYSTNGGPFILTGTVPASNAAVLQFNHFGLTATTNRYCYYIRAVDSCSNTNISVPSNIHCPVLLQGNAGNLTSNLRWRPYVGFNVSNYTVQKIVNNAWQNIATVPGNDTDYVDMANLSCGQVAIYRILTTESAGGNNQTSLSNQLYLFPFDTIKPAAPELISVSVRNYSVVEVNFKKVADPDVRTYNIYASTGAGFNFIGSINSTAPVIQYLHTGANPTVLRYSYYIRAVDSCSNLNISRNSNVHGDILLQGTAGNLRNTLNWRTYTGFNYNQVKVQRLNGAVWTTIATLPRSDSSYIDSIGTYCNVPYSYRIVADEIGGNVQTSNSNLLVLTPFKNTFPDKPIINYVTITGPNSAELNWIPSNDKTVITYVIYRGPIGGPMVQVGTKAAVAPYTFLDNTVSGIQRPWCYYVRAVDSCAGTASAPSDIHCTIKVNVKQDSCNLKVNVNWNTYRGWSTGVSRYDIFKSTANGPYVYLATNTGTDSTYEDFAVAYGVDYCYKVIGFQQGGGFQSASSEGNCINLSSLVVPTISLVSVIASSTTNGQVDITWPSLANVSAAGYYTLYHSTTAGGPFTQLATNIPINQTNYNHSNINTKDNEHYYQITMTDLCGNESVRSVTHKTVNLTLSGGQISHQLDWTPYQGLPVIRYDVYRYENGAWQYKASTPSNVLTYLFSPAPCNSPLFYRVAAATNNGLSYSDTSGITAIDSLPADGSTLLNASVLNDFTIEVTYKEADSTDIYGYILLRSTNGSPFGPLRTIYNVNGAGVINSLLDTVGTLTGYHCYKMITIDSCLNETDSKNNFCAMQLEGTAGNNQNNLNWRPIRGYTVSQYEIQTLNAGIWSTIATVPGTDTLFNHGPNPPLACNVPVIYRIRSTNANDASITSLSDTIRLTPYDNQAPPAPTIISVSITSATTAAVNYRMSSDPDVARVIVEYSENGGAWIYAGVSVAGANQLGTFVHNGIDAANKTYCYRIFATDSCNFNNSLPSSTHCAVQLAGNPGHLSSSLNWSGYSGFNVDWYYIQILVNGVWVTVDSVMSGTTTYLDLNGVNGLPCKVPVIYRISTKELGGNNQISLSDSIIIIPFDTVAPAKPFMLSASVLGGNSIGVRYQMSATGDIYRTEIQYSENGGPWTIAGTMGALPSSTGYFIHNGIDPANKNYCYRVLAIDSCNDNKSVPSDPHCVVQMNGSSGNLSSQLTWSAYSGFNVEWYYIQILVNGQWVIIDSVAAGTTNYLDTKGFNGLACKLPYTYKITTKELGGNNQISLSDSVVIIPFDTIPPAKPSVLSASVISGSAITVNYQMSATGDINKCEIQYTENGGPWTFAGISASGPNAVGTFIHGGIDPANKDYCYRAIAIDSCADNRSVPSDPHCVVQMNGSSGNLSSQLTWSSYSGFSVDWYYIQILVNGQWITIDSVRSGTTNYLDTQGFGGIACNVQYIYRVVTKELNGNLQISLSDSVRVTPFDTIKPLAPTLNYVTVLSNTQVEIGWSASTSGDVTKYEVWRKDPVTGLFSLITTLQGQFQFVDIVPSTLTQSYDYYVTALDSCSTLNRSLPSLIHNTMDVKSPGKTTCRAEVPLSWENYINFPSGLNKYRIFRSVSGGAFTLYDSVTAASNSYLDVTVDTALTYCYQVYAVSNNGQFESLSDTLCIKPSIFPDSDPTSIKNTTVLTTGVANGSIQIDWRSVDPVIDTLARYYNLYHSTISRSGPFTRVYNSVDLNDSTYVHNGIDTKNQNHYYMIRVANKCAGESDTSGTHMPVNLTGVNGNLAITLNWTQYTGWAPGTYVLQRLRTNGAWQQLGSFVGPTQYVDTMVHCGIPYTYRVTTTSADGRFISLSDTVTLVAYDTIPPAIAGVNVATVLTTSTTTGQIRIDFVAPLEKNRSGYNVYRSVNGGASTFLANIVNASAGVISYTDQNLDTKGSNYSYTVTSLDSCGNESLVSELHQPVNISVTAASEVNNVAWTAYQGFANFDYTVQRKTASTAWTNLATVASTSVAYADSAVQCDTLYYYRIQTSDLAIVPAINSLSDTASATAFDFSPPTPPNIDYVTIDATSTTLGTVSIYWSGGSRDNMRYFLYRRTQANPAWTQIATLGLQSSYQDINLNTASEIYLYRLESLDSCGNAAVAPSAEHGTISLKTTPWNEAAKLTWTPYIGDNVNSYNIYRDNVLVGSVSGNQYNYTDTFLLCTQTYNYYIEARLQGGNFRSLSNQSGVRPFDTNRPYAAYVKVASVEPFDSLITVRIADSRSFDIKGYDLLRKASNEDNWTVIAKLRAGLDTVYQDRLFVDTKNLSYCYAVVGSDFCSNTSDTSNVGCTIILDGTSLDLASELTWSPYTSWAGGVDKYEIWRSDDGAAPLKVGEVGGNVFSFIDNNLAENVVDFCYEVIAVEGAGSYDEKSRSNDVCLRQKAKIFIATGFTPGTSIGLNDVFGPVGTYYKSLEMSIYNRWGEEIFFTNDKNVLWNGRYHNTGELVPEGAYVYKFRVIDLDDKPLKFKGMINVVY